MYFGLRSCSHACLSPGRCDAQYWLIGSRLHCSRHAVVHSTKWALSADLTALNYPCMKGDEERDQVYAVEAAAMQPHTGGLHVSHVTDHAESAMQEKEENKKLDQ